MRLVALALAIALTVCAARSGSSSTLRVASIGDWGDPAHFATTHFAERVFADVDMIISNGDNFYPLGVASTDDPQWQDNFLSVFPKSVPTFAVLGNHGYYGNDTAQLEFAKTTHRWRFPDRYYVIETEHAKILMLDTWRLCGGDSLVYYDPIRNVSVGRTEEVHENPHVADALRARLPRGKKKRIIDEEQYEWLSDELNKPTHKWKIVVGHFPVHSSSVAEHGDSRCLKSRLSAVLEAGHVDMYVAGHDHISQHLKINDIHFVGSGAGAMKHKLVNRQYPGLVWVQPNHYGIAVHEITETELQTTFKVVHDDAVVDDHVFTLYKGDAAEVAVA